MRHAIFCRERVTTKPVFTETHALYLLAIMQTGTLAETVHCVPAAKLCITLNGSA
jgi:hypothetical protein